MEPDPTETAGEPVKSVCIHRRAAGGRWWRVDADIAPDGTLTVTGGDATEWQAIVRPGAKRALLRALRRDGELALAVGGDADDELLARLADRFSAGETGHFEAVRTYLDANGIGRESRFWAGEHEDEAAPGIPPERIGALRAVLADAVALVTRDGADFTWSSWTDAAAAHAELAGLLERLPADPVSVAGTVSVIFAPTGPFQELAMASGWSAEYLALAERADRALAEL